MQIVDLQFLDVAADLRDLMALAVTRESCFGGSEVDTRSATGRVLLTTFVVVTAFERALC